MHLSQLRVFANSLASSSDSNLLEIGSDGLLPFLLRDEPPSFWPLSSLSGFPFFLLPLLPSDGVANSTVTDPLPGEA
eukprot:XP_001705414.1 Hypothetical protein GL50803_39269 [Giardia lamblia ATCC 50803]